MFNFEFVAERDSSATLDRQLYGYIGRAILRGDLAPGQRLPSSRELAEILRLSRSTVVDAYRQLTAEGYLETKSKSKTFVCGKLPTNGGAQSQQETRSVTRNLTELGKRLSKTALSSGPWQPSLEISFYSWRTSFDEVPLEQWTRSLWRRQRVGESSMLDFPEDRAGSMRLRSVIAEMVKETRGIECKARQVVIVSGWTQALDIVARLFVTASSRVALEDPTFPEVRELLQAAGAECLPIEVDAEGIVVSQMERKLKQDLRLVYVSPSHQFPTGAVMSTARRLELLDWARRSGVLIVEDDYDSDFRYSGQVIPALASMDRAGNVVYVGTFTKTLYPSFGIGYMVVPEELCDMFIAARRMVADALPLQMQEALADFISEGHLKRHIKRMRPIYEERRQALLHSLSQHMGDRVTIFGDSAGLGVAARIKTVIPDQILIGRCAKAGVGLVSTSNCYAAKSPRGEYLFGFANLTVEEIREGVRRIGTIIHHTQD